MSDTRREEHKRDLLRLFEGKEDLIKDFDRHLSTGTSLGARIERFAYALRKYGIKALYYLTWFFPATGRARAFWGKKIYVDLPEDIAVVFFGALPGFEAPLTKFLIKNLRHDSIFYDVGAHVGFYTSLAKELVTEGEIHSFEANPKTFEILKKNADREGMHATRIGVTGEEGERVFYADLNKMSGMSGFRMNPHFSPISVRTTTLDAYTRDHTPPTIVKIDVEGVEEEVLKGARHMLSSSSPVIIVELWKGDEDKKDHRETMDMLFAEGYRVYGITGDGELEFLKDADQSKNLGFDNFVFKKD